ncbi:ATPase-like protein [Coniochaeta sp. 2T2.1]|nr:ATPase-like protein [Coniochaeta sp. 2T2.1]
MFTNCTGDEAFGPIVHGCRDGFDFTTRFERIVFAILPSCVFLALSVVSAVVSIRRSKGKHTVSPVLLASWIAHAVLSLVLLVLVAVQRAPASQPLFIASTATTFVSSLCIAVASLIEHRHARRPSVIVCSFLLLTLLFDIVQTRTLWLSTIHPVEVSFSSIFTGSLAVKLGLLFLESQHKKPWYMSEAESPEETAGIFDLGSLAWLGPLFRAGNKTRLVLDDLFPLPLALSTEVAQSRLLKTLHSSSHRGSRSWLLRALGRTLTVSLLCPVVPRLALTGFKFCQPFLIFSLLNHLRQHDAPRSHGYGLIGAAILIYLGIAVSTSFYWYFHERTLCMTRAALAGAIYRKTTEIPLPAASKSAALTLMSTDVERIRYGFLNLHEFWANTIEVAIASWLLYRQLGAAVAAPLVVVVCCIIGGAVTNRFTRRRQKAWMAKIQKRVGLTAEAISNMKSLKMSGLAPVVETLTQAMRIDELDSASRYRLVYVIVIGFGYAPTALCSVMTFAVTARELDVTTIFTSLSYLFLLADPLGYIFQNTPHLIAAIACLERIQVFVEQEPQVDYRSSDGAAPGRDKDNGTSPMDAPSSEVQEQKCEIAAAISDGSFGWESGGWVLRNVNTVIPASALTMVVGPVASGKSTLCKVLLGAIPVSEGKVTIYLGGEDRKVAYCDQDPYLWNASIRENILGFSSFHKERYHEVLEAAALLPDFDLLPDGDLTRAWGSGSTLSGGQRQRVSLARALYADASLLIFDDVLSGLDEDTAAQVFLRSFGPDGLIRRRGATALLCTHSIGWLPLADHVVVLGHGTVLEQGKLAELSATVREQVGVTKADSQDPSGAANVRRGPKERPEATSTLATQVMDSYVTEKQRMTGDSTVYKHYLSSLGWKSVIAIVICSLGWGFFYNWGNIWLKYWAEDVTSAHQTRTNGFFLGLYGLFQLAFLLSMVLCFLVCYRNGIANSGAQLHQRALSTVVRAPLSFFSKTDIGAVTSLFSQDMGLLDNELPISVANLALDVCNAVGMAAVIASASPYLAIAYPPVLVVLYYLQKFYLRTSRQLRLLDLEAKAPLYTHYIDTIRGLATFRAFQWEENGVDKNSILLTASQRPAYLLAMIQRALMFVLQLVVAIMAAVVVVIATQLRTSSALTGASLVTLMTFGDVLNYIIRWWTQIETSIGAVGRLKGFSEKVVSESLEGEDLIPAKGWPFRGGIEINGTSASYLTESLDDSPPDGDHKDAPAQSLALKNFSISIRPGEKLAICGRTGSGKSSVILLLLRLLDPLSSCRESITIDDVPLHKIDRSVLRGRFITIPQEPSFLPDGTPIQSNLDPYGQASEEECKSVLEAVGLWAAVQRLGGLQAGLYPTLLSQGQKQLFSLARAVLKRRVRTADQQLANGIPAEIKPCGGVLLIDEVSSTVDVITELAMMRVIQQEFDGYTVVMVTHRLEMLQGFDTMVVMDRGTVVETGRLAEMVRRDGGTFRNSGN